MNETELIIQAIHKGITPKRKKKILQDLDPDPLSLDADKDVIWRLAKKIRTPKKKKYLSEWSSVDFLRHLDHNLKIHHISLASNEIRDREMVNRLYDLLVHYFSEEMNNTVLRDYLDWWVGTYSFKYSGREVYIQTLMNDECLQSFVDCYETKTPHSSPKQNTDRTSVSDLSIYKMGNLSLLLMSRGIVAGYRALIEDGYKSTANSKIRSALLRFSQEILIQVLEITISKVYNTKYMIDFISLAKSSLEQYGLLDAWAHIDYKDYFIEEN